LLELLGLGKDDLIDVHQVTVKKMKSVKKLLKTGKKAQDICCIKTYIGRHGKWGHICLSGSAVRKIAR
jgi:hypothetical protein